MHFPVSQCVYSPYTRLSRNVVHMSAAFDLASGRSGNPSTYRCSLPRGLRQRFMIRCEQSPDTTSVSPWRSHTQRPLGCAKSMKTRHSRVNPDSKQTLELSVTPSKCWCNRLDAWRQNISCAICSLEAPASAAGPICRHQHEGSCARRRRCSFLLLRAARGPPLPTASRSLPLPANAMGPRARKPHALLRKTLHTPQGWHNLIFQINSHRWSRVANP